MCVTKLICRYIILAGNFPHLVQVKHQDITILFDMFCIVILGVVLVLLAYNMSTLPVMSYYGFFGNYGNQILSFNKLSAIPTGCLIVDH
jgi:hypothetical protein